MLGTTLISEQKAQGAQSSVQAAHRGPLDACSGQAKCYRVLFPCAVAESCSCNARVRQFP